MAPAQIIVKQMNGVESWDLWLHHNGPAGHSPLTAALKSSLFIPEVTFPPLWKNSSWEAESAQAGDLEVPLWAQVCPGPLAHHSHGVGFETVTGTGTMPQVPALPSPRETATAAALKFIHSTMG